MGVKKQQLEPYWNNGLEKSMIRLYVVILLISLICRVPHAKCQAGESQPGIKITGRNIGNLRNADNTTLTAENEEELKSLLMQVKEESEKAGLKLNIQKN